MTTKTLKLRGYTATLELYTEDGQPRSDCFIEKGNYTASLACAEDTGFLTDQRDEQKEIDQGTLDQIREWAEENGY